MIGPRRVDKPLVLYGHGRLGHLAEEVFKKIGVPIYQVFDKSCPPCFNPVDCLVAICIASEPYAPIADKLRADGFTDIVSVYDIFEAYPECGITSGWFVGSVSEEDVGGLTYVTSIWLDRLSKVHYLQFVRWHEYREDFFPYEYPIDPTNRWYIPEVKETLRMDKEHIRLENPGSTLSDIADRKSYRARFPYDDPTPLTYIQLHCEGNELVTIQDNMGYFQKYRPIIAVTVYHTRDGLWAIEKTLMDNLENYRWYFRLHAHQGQAAIMYGVPKERNGRGGQNGI